jgi:hypothetical protein
MAIPRLAPAKTAPSAMIPAEIPPEILDSKMEGQLFSDVVDKFVRARANGYFDNVDEDGFPILPDPRQQDGG